MMKLSDALKWADVNSQPKVVERLRSRNVAKTLAAAVRSYADWIREEGVRTNTCTRNILDEICPECECGKKGIE